jgi:hypothetical protein
MPSAPLLSRICGNSFGFTYFCASAMSSFQAADAFVSFLDIGGVRRLDFCQGNFFCRVVRGANLVCAFEGHVLEHVGEAGLSHGVLHRAGVHVSIERKDWGLGTLADQYGETVVQLLDRDSLFERCQILRGGDGGQH